jgi:hypothetical protein
VLIDSVSRLITDDWSQVSPEDLEREPTAHLDELRFRYYIPELMLGALGRDESSNSATRRVVNSISAKAFSFSSN